MSAKLRKTLSWLPDYDISEDGEIRRITPAKTRGAVPYIVRGSTCAKGYRRVKLMTPNGNKAFLPVHRLVCEAFYGPPPKPGLHAAHWDGQSTNNHFKNLRWATALENVGEDRARHGRLPKGQRNGRAILTEDQVVEIRTKYKEKHGDVAKLAREYGVSHSAMLSVCRGEHWSHV